MADAPDYFELVMEEARCRGAGAPEMLRLEALKWEFLARAAPGEHHRFPAYAAAVLFRRHDERASFARKLAPPAAARPDVKGEEGEGTEKTPTPAPLKPGLGERSAALLAVAQLAVVILGIALLHFLTPAPETIEPPPPPPPTDIPTSLPTASPVPPDMIPVLRSDLWWWAIVAAIVAAALAYVVWRRLRRVRLRRDATDNAQPFADVAVRVGRSGLFADAVVRPALRALRRPRAVPSQRVDVARSIHATLVAGEPVICYAPRLLSPEYLLLSEREVPQDHLPEIFEALGERFDQAQIVNARYEFHGDPAQLRLVSGGGRDDFEPLEAVLAKHEGARVLVLMESHDALAGVRRWLDTASLENVTLLVNPRQRSCWGEEERRLRTAGLPCLPASPEGIAELAERIGRGMTDADGRAAEPAEPEPDLAAFLARHRAMLMSAIAPDSQRIDAVVANLERWLDSGAMDWLRTIALFPAINSGFTFFAGATLAESTLITHSRYLAIARLPWLRAGYMPAWLREALVRGFTPQKLERATAVVQAYLLPSREPVAGRQSLLGIRKQGENPASRRKLLARLAANENPLYADSLLLGALAGTPPEALEVSMPDPALGRRRWFERPELHAAAGALAALALLCALVPPLVWTPRDIVPPPDNSVADDLANAAEDAANAVEAAADNASYPANETQPANTVEPVVPPVEPVTPPVKPAGRPVVYIQIGSPSLRPQALKLVGALEGLRLGGEPARFPGIEVRPSRLITNQIRCFTPKTCAEARKLQAAMGKAGVSAAIQAVRKTGSWTSATAPENQYEIWLAGREPAPIPTPAPTPSPTQSPVRGPQSGQTLAPPNAGKPAANGSISYFGNYTGEVVTRSSTPKSRCFAGCPEAIGGSLSVQLEYRGNRVTGSFRGTGGIRESKLIGTRDGNKCRLFDAVDGSEWSALCDDEVFQGGVASVQGAAPQIQMKFTTLAVNADFVDTPAR
jgi:hypothetical protein